MEDENQIMDQIMEPVKGVFLGERGENFKMLITSILNKGKLKKERIDLLTSENNMKVYDSVFTSENIDENSNYQVYEQLGDLTGNKFIVWYIYKRFPQLQCANGVKVAARLRINYGSKQSFCNIAEKLGFWEYISATKDLRQRKKKSLLEDVFEAFLGATESMLDEQVGFGTGYVCVYKILKAIFDEIPISLRYEDLYDAKTRLKELFDMATYNENSGVSGTGSLGSLSYEETKQNLITYSTAYKNTRLPNGSFKKIQIGKGSASLKADAQQMAAENALAFLATNGHVKRPPKIYNDFVNDRSVHDRSVHDKSSKTVAKETTREDVLKVCEKEADINEQKFTRGKSKYQSKYTSTTLIHYCRKRDIPGIQECVKLGADANVQDIVGLTAFDITLIGAEDYKTVKKIFKLLRKTIETEPVICEDVANRYRDVYPKLAKYMP